MAKVTLDEWLEYLESRVNVDLYVWGANGESLVEILPRLCQKEKSLDDVDRTLTLLQKRLLNSVDVYDIHCEDCSGLSIRFLLAHKVITSDMTANGLYEYITKGHGKKISPHSRKHGEHRTLASPGIFLHLRLHADKKTDQRRNLLFDEHGKLRKPCLWTLRMAACSSC